METIDTLEIKNSSAISKISFWYSSDLIGITFTKSKDQDKEYLYHCNTLHEVRTKIVEAEILGESVGKLIHKFRKDGVFVQLEEFE